MFTFLFVLALVVAAIIWALFKPKTLADFGADFVTLEDEVKAGVSKPAPAQTVVQPAAKPSADTKPQG